MVSVEQTEKGLVLSVKALPGARRNGVTGVHDGALKVAVSQAPEKGKATAAIMNVLAESLGIKKNQIELLSGQTSTHKKFLIRNIALDEIMKRISELLDTLSTA